jgi:hypothetical protein
MTITADTGLPRIGRHTDPRARRAAAVPPPVLQQVTDCAEWAWWVSTQTCLTALDATTITAHRGRLDRAASVLIAPELVYEWALRGYAAILVPAAVFAPERGTDATYWAVADAAAAAIPPAVLLAAAGIQPGIGR